MLRAENQKAVAENGGMQQSGGCLWFKGKPSLDTGADQFAEDLSFLLKNLHSHTSNEADYPYDFPEINEATSPLGIPWETSKDVQFLHTIPFIGFTWDLAKKWVSLPESKKLKYLCAIAEWKPGPPTLLTMYRSYMESFCMHAPLSHMGELT